MKKLILEYYEKTNEGFSRSKPKKKTIEIELTEKEAQRLINNLKG